MSPRSWLVALGVGAGVAVIVATAGSRDEHPTPASTPTTVRATTTTAPLAPTTSVLATPATTTPDPSDDQDRGWTLVGTPEVGEDAVGNFAGSASFRNDGTTSRMATFRIILTPDGSTETVGVLIGTVIDVRSGETVTVDLWSDDAWSERAARYLFQVGTTS